MDAKTCFVEGKFVFNKMKSISFNVREVAELRALLSYVAVTIKIIINIVFVVSINHNFNWYNQILISNLFLFLSFEFLLSFISF